MKSKTAEKIAERAQNGGSLPGTQSASSIEFLLDPGGIMPRRSYQGDAGYDLYSAKAQILSPGMPTRVETFVRVVLPAGWWAQVMDRSSMANQFLKNEEANISTDQVVNTLVLIVLVTALVGIVASQVNTAQTDGNISATEATLLGLLTLVFILVPVIAIFRQVGN